MRQPHSERGTCSRRNSAALPVCARPHTRCPVVLAVGLSESAVSMLATLRNNDRRWFQLHVEPLIAPAANRRGECQADKGCTPGRADPPAAVLAPPWTPREGRSGTPAP